MTIHKSKGLEFPIVILPFNGKKDKHGNVIWVEEEGGELPAYYFKGSKKYEKTRLNEDYLEEKDKTTLDMVNLQYVAFTRAKNALFISGKEYGSSQKWLKEFIDANYPDKLICPPLGSNNQGSTLYCIFIEKKKKHTHPKWKK